MKSLITLFSMIALLAACSMKVSDGGPGAPIAPPQKLVLSGDPLTGTLNGAAWTPQFAIAKKLFNDDEYSVTLAGAGEPVTCSNWFPRQAHVSFSVPTTPGTFVWDSAHPVSGSYLVNVVFPYVTENGGGATTALADVSVIRVDSLDGGVLRGAVAAQNGDGSHSFNFNGVFAATICP